MKPNRCNFCKGTLALGLAEYTVHVEDQVLVISKIPAWICDNCNEPYFTPESSRKIDEIIKKAKEHKILVHPLAGGKIILSESN